jgi:hypothetical protein
MYARVKNGRPGQSLFIVVRRLTFPSERQLPCFRLESFSTGPALPLGGTFV